VRALADLRCHPHRQLRPRLLLYARRVPDLHARRDPAARRRRVLRRRAAGRGGGRSDRPRRRGDPAAPRVPGARALPAPPHVRAGACRRRPREALPGPRQPLRIVMSASIITGAFVVVVVGGIGSVAGALLAAVLISVIDAFSVLVLPRASLVMTFVVMAVVLIVRPWGLLGRPEAPQ